MATVGRLARTLPQLFVYRLRWTVDRDSLASYFSRFGEVKYAEVSFDEKTGVSRLFGKVRMSSDEELQSILDTDQHKIEGSVVKVKMDEPTRRRPVGPAAVEGAAVPASVSLGEGQGVDGTTETQLQS